MRWIYHWSCINVDQRGTIRITIIINSLISSLLTYFIIKVIEVQVMTTKRIVQLKTHPLTYGELINTLSTKNPIYREEEDAFLGLFLFLY